MILTNMVKNVCKIEYKETNKNKTIIKIKSHIVNEKENEK